MTSHAHVLASRFSVKLFSDGEGLWGATWRGMRENRPVIVGWRSFDSDINKRLRRGGGRGRLSSPSRTESNSNVRGGTECTSRNSYMAYIGEKKLEHFCSGIDVKNVSIEANGGETKRRRVARIVVGFL